MKKYQQAIIYEVGKEPPTFIVKTSLHSPKNKYIAHSLKEAIEKANEIATSYRFIPYK